ncbi:hypothetical protein N7474_007659 [Penicillium riverlandense]|uniref:uncharacterized protein n=1 Tax=Penicillium riverlandense TaxID=1903569 RepID=UPI00254713EB|nr:uncharacterized protein N7474_007659 [Penicillium riverlandense]KAJ5811358.1 hypothetical protein N7474_007659 [Penicillium riverlandense]
MKLFSVFTTALLSLAVDATPVPEGGTPFSRGALADRFSQRVANASADGEAEMGDLAKRSQLTCEIVNVVTTVDCHYWPTHADVVEGSPPVRNYVVTSFGPSTKHDFDCYLPGENVGGIT